MRRVFRRSLVIGAATAALFGIGAAPASADNTYHPSDADFADCPARPAAATGTWTCYVMTALGGVVRLDKMSANITEPWRLTVAQGTVSGGKVAVLGGLSADPVPFVSGIPGTPFVIPNPLGWQLRPYTTGDVSPGNPVPTSLGLKAQIIGDGLGDTCTVGPTTIKPKVSWTVPWVFDGVLEAKTQVYDDVYALPAASGCTNNLTVDTLLGVPANATSNYIQVQWALRHKTY